MIDKSKKDKNIQENELMRFGHTICLSKTYDLIYKISK